MFSFQKCFLSIFFLFLYLNCFQQKFSKFNFAEASSISRQQSQARLEKLRSKKSAFINGNENFFKNYILAGQRPYDLIVIFTSEFKDSSCKGCKMLIKALEPIAQRYKKTRLAGKGDVFFITFQYNQKNSNLFQKLNLQSIPKMIYIPYSRSSRLVSSQSINSNWLKQIPKQHNQRMFSFDQNAIIDWITRVTQIAPIKAEGPKFSRKMVQIAFLIIIALLGLYLVAGNQIQTNRRLFKLPCACFVLLFYIYNISGGQFNRIHGVPQSGRGADQIYHESRMQYELEGIIVGLSFLFGGFLIWLLIMVQTLPPLNQKNADKNQSDDFLNESIFSRLPSSLVLIISIIAIVYFVFNVFSAKQQGYNNGFVGFFG